MIYRYRALDLFCGAGGSTKGLQRAGFHVTGVDNRAQPRYPGDEFYRADALEFCAARGREYDLIAASPPCQFASEATPMPYRSRHPNMIPAVRLALQATGRAYIIENVENARKHLVSPVMLCGSMFGLGVWRHRYFELSFPPMLTPPCNHSQSPVTLVKAGSNSRKARRLPVLITGTTRRLYANGGRFEFTADECRKASGLYWMTRAEMDQAIPPAYMEFIGRHFIAYLERLRA